MIHGLPFRLSISDCFSVTMISANMTSEYHNNFFASFKKNKTKKTYLMPSWFHLIRIALNLLFFVCFCFCFFAVCLLVDSNLQPSHPFAFILFYHYYFIFFTHSPFYCIGSTIRRSIFKCLLNNVSLVKAHSGFLLALSPGLCY